MPWYGKIIISRSLAWLYSLQIFEDYTIRESIWGRISKNIARQIFKFPKCIWVRSWVKNITPKFIEDRYKGTVDVCENIMKFIRTRIETLLVQQQSLPLVVFGSLSLWLKALSKKIIFKNHPHFMLSKQFTHKTTLIVRHAALKIILSICPQIPHFSQTWDSLSQLKLNH